MTANLASMLHQLKERITYFGFEYDPCEPITYDLNGKSRTYQSVTFYHPDKLMLAGSFSITITEDGKTDCSLSPINIQGSFKHCYDALWLGLKLWKEYGINSGGEGE